MRDFSVETPASDDVFELYQRLYAYDRTPLDAETRSSDTTDVWVREYVT
ncbi:MAG: hypothetical protein GWN71_40410, partial [Gammaproteobacteria bacterium]|nr:hypothetical protein [Gemmatimonadota bacterium]NIR41467.1 hypothetical protein [Actinomycetota bacterium]NIU79583.1 hypothetical protein [Gammaproteobacteria bacterium]